MRLPTTSITSYKNNLGFLTVEIIIAFSLFILFTISTFALDSSIRQLKTWSVNRLAYIKESSEKLNISTTTLMYGNDSTIISSGPFSITTSDFANAWGQSSCSPRITFDKNKTALYTSGISLGTGNKSTDVEVRNSIVYVTADSSTQSQSDFFIIDATIPTSTKIVSSLNTGPGLSAITVAGQYAFVANTSSLSQMQAINMSNRSSPSIVAELKLPLPEASTTPTQGKSVFYRNGFIYLGTAKWDGPEFYIIDVSNPVNPIIVGNFETSTLVNDIYVVGNTAYLATSDEYQLRVLDVSNKNYPQLTYTSSPTGWQTQEGKVLDYFEKTLLFGRTVGGFNVTANHEAFIFSSTSPQNVAHSKDIPGGIYGILYRDPHIFLLTHSANAEFQVFDDSLRNKIFSKALSSTPVAMACDWSTLYFATGDSGGLSILQLQ